MDAVAETKDNFQNTCCVGSLTLNVSVNASDVEILAFIS